MIYFIVGCVLGGLFGVTVGIELIKNFYENE